MNRANVCDLYYQMLRIRVVEETIAGLYPEQEMRCPVHLSIGQEAVPVGVSAHLGPQDGVVSAHRSHGHYLAKGGDLRRMIAELYGKATGCSGGVGGSMHLIDLSVGFMGAAPIVGSTIAIAAGIAFARQMQGSDAVTVVYFGDGAVEEGVFYESLNFAALKRLPIVFVCENNLYSVYSPLNVRQPDGRQIVDVARGIGVEGHQADGNNVDIVYGLAGYAVEKARRGRGPTFLEFLTYRRRAHVGPDYDDDLGYRPQEEVEVWRARCPVVKLAKGLLERGLASKKELEEMTAAIREEVDAAVAQARADPFPDPSLLFEHIYRA